MSRSVEGPWAFQGILNELAGNSRPAFLDYKGDTYFIDHNGGLKNGGSTGGQFVSIPCISMQMIPSSARCHDL